MNLNELELEFLKSLEYKRFKLTFDDSLGSFHYQFEKEFSRWLNKRGL